jgi:hypothetical protein
VCGQAVPPNAVACPECGACHDSGWKENAEVYDGLDFLDDAAESDDGRVRWGKKPGLHPFWRIVALVAVLALFWYFWKALFAAGRTPLW